MRSAPLPLSVVFCLITMMALAGCASTQQIPDLNRETTDLQDVVEDVLTLEAAMDTDRVLVVFDLDNTLLAMEQGLGSDQWYEWQKDKQRESPCDPRVVQDRLAAQGALYFASAMRPTQENAPAMVRQLQSRGLSVIALTSRGVDFRLQTFRELRRNGYDFRPSALPPDAGWPEDFVPERGSRPVRYEDGVFLTTGQHKGEMLLELLRRTDTPMPGVVVMVDDKQKNLDDVLASFSSLGVPVHAWRYAREDERVENFDPDASHALWLTLEPALRTLQDALGPDHYRLPEAEPSQNCD